MVGRSCLTESQGENDASFAIMSWRQRQLRVGYKPGLSGVKKKKKTFIDSSFFAGLVLVRISTVKSLKSTEDYV